MSDVRALLLTDVVDSTRLSEQLGDQEMAALWASHDRVARDLLPLWGGREIDKADGMLLLFDDAADGLRYAIAYHRALADLAVPLSARAGLHVGPVILRESSPGDVARGAKPMEVDGVVKPTVARVMSVARGGQTLLTADARAALGDLGLAVHSHGYWLMKGISVPVELFEAGEDFSSFAAPRDSEKVYRVVRVGGRWLPVREVPNNLPQPTTSFIGRDREISELKTRLGTARLVTLLGMGGLGKTRLALQVAAEVLAEYPDGVWFLDLAPIRNAALVASETANLLGVREEPGRSLTQSLCVCLAQRRVLLIFDNCEHLVEPVADLAHAVLCAASSVRIVATSRERLRVPGEQAMPIPPLPAPNRDDSLESLAQCTAIRLFVERAQSQNPAFSLNVRVAPAVAELVTWLEGIPLALELAAARVSSISVADLNHRLGDRYRLLVGGSRVLQTRQRTLRALVDWSYELLDTDEQTMFERLSVFTGGFDLPAAEHVCGSDRLTSVDVMDGLSSLVDKSLVILNESGIDARYRMLETLRDYAWDKLQRSGQAAAVASAHCQHYLLLAKQIRDAMDGPEQGLWVGRGEADLDNLRAATAFSLTEGADPVIAVKIAVALQNFWLLRGYAGEGREVVRAALAQPAVQASDLIVGHALYVGACLAFGQSDHKEAQELLETSLALRRGLGDPVDIAATLSTLAMVLLMAGDAESATVNETEALRLFGEAGHRLGRAVGHQHLASYALFLGRDDEAAAQIEQGLRLTREIGYREAEAGFVLLRAEWAFEAGEMRLAHQACAESLAICQDSGNRRGQAKAQAWLARLAVCEAGFELLRTVDMTGASAYLSAALQDFSDFVMRDELLGGLEVAAQIALVGRRGPLAAALAAAVDRSRERLGLRRSPRAAARWQTWRQRLATQVDVAGLTEGTGQADGWTLQDASRAALAAQAEWIRGARIPAVPN